MVAAIKNNIQNTTHIWKEEKYTAMNIRKKHKTQLITM